MKGIRKLIYTHHFAVSIALAVLLPLLPSSLLFSVPQTAQYISPVLLFLPGVILTSWYAGFRMGILTTIISGIGLLYFSFFPQPHVLVPNIPSIINSAFFLLEGLLISLAIEYYKHTQKDTAYRRQEKKYQYTIEQLEREKIKIQEDIKSRDEFLSIASHELRTPLTTMLLQLQTALYNVRNVSLANFSVQNLLSMLESTEHQSKQLAKMINDLLNVSLITTGRLTLELEKVDLSAVTKDVTARFSEKLLQNGQKITVKSEKNISIYADKLRLEQVLTNLISNAIKYGNTKPINVEVSQRNGSGTISIEDHGIGIAPDKKKMIFARFKRAVTSPRYEGLGVGLYIAQQIVLAHDGSIAVESRPGKGTTFVVKLPVKGPKNGEKEIKKEVIFSKS